MTKNIGQLVGDVYAILEGQNPEDNLKILNSLITLLGLGQTAAMSKNAMPLNSNNTPNFSNKDTSSILQPTGDAKAFFDMKQPQNKGEDFAVAASYRQAYGMGEDHKKDDLRDIIKGQARRKFDDKNFVRDMKNAVGQAGFFMAGNNKNEYLLSSLGEAYVNALPDRAAAMEAKKNFKSSKPRKKVPSKKKSKK